MDTDIRNYQVLRMAKHKKLGWGAFLAHATRLHAPTNVNPNRMPENLHFIGLNDDLTLKEVDYPPLKTQALVRERAKQQVDQRVGKLRSNAVYVSETIISASHDVMESMTKDEQIQYLKDGVQFLIEKFGQDNFISAHFHFDEITPHAHVFMSAVTKDEKTQKFKTHFKAFIDGPFELEQFQDQFHEQIGKRYNLAPNNKKNRATHTELSEFYELMDTHKTGSRTKNLEELSKVIEKTYAIKAQNELMGVFNALDDVLHSVTGKTSENLNHEELSVFKEVFNENAVKPLRLRYERKIEKKDEEKRTQEEREAEEKRQKELAYQRYAKYMDKWKNRAEDYAEEIGESWHKQNSPNAQFTKPLTDDDAKVALQQRIDELQEALKKFYDDPEQGLRLKENVSRMLGMMNFKHDKSTLQRFVDQPIHSVNDEYAGIQEWIYKNPQQAINTISEPYSARQIISQLIWQATAFIQEFKEEIRNLRELKREQNYRTYKENLRRRIHEDKLHNDNTMKL